MIQVPLPENAEVSVSIRACENYELSAFYWVSGKNNQNEIIKDNIEKKSSPFLQYTIKAVEDSNLNIYLQHNIPITFLGWFYLGGFLALITIPSVQILYHYNPENIVGIISLSAIITTILVMIKSWLFLENMEKITRIDFFYMSLILISIVQILGIALHYHFIFKV